MERLTEEELHMSVFLRACYHRGYESSPYCRSFDTPLPQTLYRNYRAYDYQMCTKCTTMSKIVCSEPFAAICAKCRFILINELDLAVDGNYLSVTFNAADNYNWVCHKLPLVYHTAFTKAQRILHELQRRQP